MTKRDEVPRGIDFEQMEAALKRAAYKAVHGTREERSGRFLGAEESRETVLEGKPTAGPNLPGIFRGA
jgi:hypothetical protein